MRQLFTEFEDRILEKVRQDKATRLALMSKLTEMQKSFDSLKSDMESIACGKDKNITDIKSKYGENCSKFYTMFRNGLFAFARYLMIYVNTGYMDTPLGESGDRIDNIEHWLELGISVMSTLPIPIIADGADIILNEILYQGVSFGKSKLSKKIESHLIIMYQLFKKEELKGERSIKSFCQQVSLQIVEACHAQIEQLTDVHDIEILARELVAKSLDSCVDKNQELEKMIKIAKAAKSKDGSIVRPNLWDQFKTILKGSLLRKLYDSLPRLTRSNHPDVGPESDSSVLSARSSSLSLSATAQQDVVSSADDTPELETADLETADLEPQQSTDASHISSPDPDQQIDEMDFNRELTSTAIRLLSDIK